MKKIFISSTFKDMQYERDILHEQVLPKLNATAMEYGDSVSLCDLRWGVDTSDLSEAESARKVLSVCLDEIDRCRPYMIIIIGARYGWIPDAATAEDLVRHRIDSLQDLERSVTEMEIEYGALSRKYPGNCLFYFRNADYSRFPASYQCESPLHEKRIGELKERIRRITGGEGLREYTISWDPETERPDGVAVFARMVEEDVKRLMTAEWESRLRMSPWEKDELLQWNQAEERAQQFAARDALIGDVKKQLDAGHRLIALRGESGSGKSMLVSKLAVDLRDEGGAVFPCFCGSSALTGTAANLVRAMTRRINDELGIRTEERNTGAPETEDSLGEALSMAVSRYEEKGTRPLTILIDAVDQLTPDAFRDEFRFLPPVAEGKVRVVLSMLDTFPVPAGLPTELIQLRALTEEEKVQVIRGILGFQSKELDESVMQRICAKEASGNPLYLSILLRRLLMMDREDFAWIVQHGDGQKAITEYENKLIDEMPDGVEAAARSVIRHVLEKMDRRSLNMATAFISMSRFGMRMEDLQGIINPAMDRPSEMLTALNFSLFTGYLRNFFLVREDGRYDFSHRIIKEGMRRLWKNPQNINAVAVPWLKRLDERDEIRRSELIWHCFGARMAGEFFGCMEGEDDALLKVADTLRDCLRYDRDRWIEEQILSLAEKETEEIRPQLRFLLHVFPAVLSGTWDDLTAGRRVLRSVRELLRRMEEERSGADEPERKEDTFFCLYHLGRICSQMGEKYRVEAKEALQEACDLYSAEEIDALLEEGMDADLARTLRDACLLLRTRLAEDGQGEKGKDLAPKLRRINQSVCGRFFRDTVTYSRMSLVEAMRYYTPSIVNQLRVKFGTGDAEARRSAMVTLESELVLFEDYSEADRISLREEEILFKELKAWMLTEMKEPIFLIRALDLYREIVEYREKQLSAEPSADNLARLSLACRRAGEISLASGSAENRKLGFELAIRSVKLEQQRAVLLGTEESLRALIASYRRLRDLYSGTGRKTDREIAVSCDQTVLELSEKAYRRWPSEKLFRSYYDSFGTFIRDNLALDTPAARKRALECGERLERAKNYRNGEKYYTHLGRKAAGEEEDRESPEENTAWYEVRYRTVWGDIALAYGGEKNRQVAASSFRKAEAAALADAEEEERQVDPEELCYARMRLADALAGRKERSESDEEVSGIYSQALEGYAALAEERHRDMDLRRNHLRCLLSAADFLLGGKRTEEADTLLKTADRLSRELSQKENSAEDWEQRCRILKAMIRTCRQTGEEDRAQSIRGELFSAAYQASVIRPCHENASVMTDCYGEEARKAIADGADSGEITVLLDNCLSLARKSASQYPEAGGSDYLYWARTAADYEFSRTDYRSWDQAVRQITEGISVMKAVFPGLPEGEGGEQNREDYFKAFERECREAAALARKHLNREGIDKKEKALLNYLLAVLRLNDTWIYIRKNGKEEGYADQTTVNNGRNAAVLLGNSSYFWREGPATAYLAGEVEHLMEDAGKVLEKDPVSSVRKHLIDIAEMAAYLAFPFDKENNELALGCMKAVEEQVEILLREKDPEAGKVANEFYNKLADTYSNAGPVRYAGKVREYRKKAKQYEET